MKNQKTKKTEHLNSSLFKGLHKSTKNDIGETETMKENTQLEESQMMQKQSCSISELAGQALNAFFSQDRELRRKGWAKLIKAIAPSFMKSRMKTDPHVFDDIIEGYINCSDHWSGFHIEFGNKEYDAETIFEQEFLTYLIRAIERGMPFREAWSRALGLVWDHNKVSRIVYELETDDKFEVELWIERIADFGVEINEATELAEEITVLLRQIYLTEDDDFYQEGMLTESDRKTRNILLQKLN